MVTFSIDNIYIVWQHAINIMFKIIVIYKIIIIYLQIKIIINCRLNININKYEHDTILI